MNDTYKTSIIDLAAYLLTKGAVFMGLTFDKPRHGVFLFQNRLFCEELHKEYLNNGQVSARDLLIRKKELMDQLAQELETQRKNYR